MRIDTLYEFMLLASNLNFTDTAKSFFISQSVLSNHISNLEKELGVRLFVRDNRSVRLTKAGEVFRDDAEKITVAYEQALANLSSHKRGTSSLIRVGFLLGTFGSFLPTLCRRYHELHPETEFSLTVLDIGEAQKALKEDKVDIAFTVFTQNLPGGEYDYQTLFEDRYKLAVPITHHLAKRQSIELADLKNERVITPRFNPLKGTLAQTGVMMEKLGVEVHTDHSITDAASLMTTLVATNNVAIALDHLGVYDRSHLVFLPIEDEKTKICAGPLWKKSNELAPLDSFVDFVSTETAGLKKEDLIHKTL